MMFFRYFPVDFIAFYAFALNDVFSGRYRILPPAIPRALMAFIWRRMLPVIRRIRR